MGWTSVNALFLLQLVPQLKDLDLHLALAVVIEDSLVGLALLVSKAVKVLGVRRAVVAGLHVCEAALDVARGATATGRGQADVV